MQKDLATTRCSDAEPGTGAQPGCGPEDELFWFHLHAIRDDDSDDGAQVGPTFDFDDFQLVFDPYNRQIRINLTGHQVEQLKLNRLIMRRIAPPAGRQNTVDPEGSA